MIYSIPIKFFRSHVLLFQKSEFLGVKSLKMWKSSTTALYKESFLEVFWLLSQTFVVTFLFVCIVWSLFCFHYGGQKMYEALKMMFCDFKAIRNKNIRLKLWKNKQIRNFDIPFQDAFSRFLSFSCNIFIYGYHMIIVLLVLQSPRV